MSNLSQGEKQRIIEEEQVRAEARQQFSRPGTTPKNQPLTPKQKRLLIISILVMIAIPFVVTYWYVALPVILIAVLWLWKKITLSKKQKLYATAAIVAVFAIVNGSMAFANRTPSITILEPKDNQTLQAGGVVLKGKVTPSYSTVTAGVPITLAKDGMFQQTIALPDEKNVITIDAKNGGKEKSVSLTVNRTFTDEEKAQRAQLAEEQAKKAQELKDAREKQAKENAILQAKQAEIDAKNKAEAAEKKDGIVASVCAKTYIEESLKAPSTAKFPWSGGNVVPLGKNKYTVQNYVDAQNSFGAMIRTNYACTVTVINPEDFVCATSCKF
jgi:hypothetical protein